MLALQKQKLKAARRVKSIVPVSVHSCLGRHGDSRGDPNMGGKKISLCCCVSHTQDKPGLS